MANIISIYRHTAVFFLDNNLREKDIMLNYIFYIQESIYLYNVDTVPAGVEDLQVYGQDRVLSSKKLQI